MKKEEKMTNQQFIAELVSIQGSMKGVKIKAGSREERLAHIRMIFDQAPKIRDPLLATAQ